MLRFSGLARFNPMSFLRQANRLRLVAIVGVVISMGLMAAGSYILISALDETPVVVAEHEIQVETVNPAGNNVGNGDNVLYQIYGNTNYADATNVLVTVNVTNAVFDIIPDICKTVSAEEYPVEPLSNISNNNTTLTCNAGAWIAGSSFRIDVTARANGPNNGKVTMDASLKSDGSEEVTGVGTPKNIVADFKTDIGIYGGATVYYYANWQNADTQYYKKGQGFALPIYWRVAMGRGSEHVGSQSFMAKITLSNPTHADQAGFSGLTAFAGGACIGLAEDGAKPATFSHVPSYMYDWTHQRVPDVAFSNGGKANSNTNSGTCALAGSGAEYTLTVNNMNTSLTHAPSTGIINNSLRSDMIQYASGVALVWVPNTWVNPTASDYRTTSVTATVSGYNPASITGLTNIGEVADNNDTVFTIIPDGTWSARWAYDPAWGGTHRFLPGDTIRSIQARVESPYYEGNDGGKTILCETISDYLTFDKIAATSVSVGNVPVPNPESYVTYEYSTKALPAVRPDSECSDADGPWLSTPPSDKASITRVRATVNHNFSVGAYINLYIDYKISETAPIGAELWTINSVSTDSGASFWHTNWASGVCVTQTAGKKYHCTSSYYDYAEVVGAKVNISKDTVGGKATYSVGEVLDYKIPISTVQREGSLTKVVVTDVLPKGLTYVEESANIEPSSVTVGGNGATTVVWNLDGVAYNEKREITYQARITAGVGVLSLTNTATAALYNESGASVLDTREAGLRSASDTINITSSGYVEIFKNSEKQEITAEDEMVFVVTMQNHDANPHQFTDVIDVFPYNGDERTPASNFHGTLDKMGIESNQKDVVFYYSTADPSTISVNPNDPSNGVAAYSIEGNTVGWTRNKPMDGVTAVRAIGGEWRPEDGDIVIRISFERDDWQHGDVFSNSVGTVARSTILKMLSTDAAITVEDESLIPAVPSTGLEPRRRVYGTKAMEPEDNSYATAMAMLWAGAFMGLAGISVFTVYVLKKQG